MPSTTKTVSTNKVRDTAAAWSKAAHRTHKKKSRLMSSPAQIWKSRLSWRIALAAFMTILLVQTCILNFGTMKNFRQSQLDQLREAGRSAVAAIIDPKSDLQKPPFTAEKAQRLFSTTKITGLSIYSYEGNYITSYGTPTAMAGIDLENLTKTYESPDGLTYEAILRTSDLKRAYFIITKFDSSHIQVRVMNFVRETIVIMLFMSLFVTVVLMIALGHWLLEPILFMRDNLLKACKDPENPDITPSPFDPDDEIGGAIDIAQNLIHQNADNLKRIKSTAEDKIHKLAYYDPLTNLPNRTLFIQTLAENARKESTEEVNRFAIVTIDLDHFKDINDSMGHNVGDAILRGVGKRLRAAMPESAIVSRTGEDEFAILMPLSSNIISARSVGERLLNVIRHEPFKVFNESFQVRASVGVATFPDDGLDPDHVLKNADIALNRAKEEGRDTLKEYTENFDRAVQNRFQILRNLRDAMEHDQLSLHYQPQLDLKTGKVIGAEALLRWWKPDNSKEGGSYISPAEFIPVAEHSGLIVSIGEWVMHTACETAAAWREEYGLDLRVAVNVSAAQFTQSDICGFTQKVINDSGLDPHKLELEVTESVFMDDIHHTIQTLQNLHAIGVELAIDDFGTGYSSLSYLRQFPIDRLKIDQSFIRNALNDNDDAAIARTIVRLGHSLNLKVIAEGVETREHEEFLLNEGCDEVQGFRYSRPVPNDDFIEFVKAYNGKLDSFDK